MADHGRPMCVDEFRQFSETDRQWRGRQEFLLRHVHLYPGPRLQQLAALSMVWSNIVFVGNRYGEQLTEKVHKMGEGIDIGEVRSYELVPGAKKKDSSSSADGQPSKKKFAPRPRFDPVHFVASTVKEDKAFQEVTHVDKQEAPDQTPDNAPQTSGLCFPRNAMDTEDYAEMAPDSSPYICDPETEETSDNKKHDFSEFMNKMGQSYSAMFESHHSSLGKAFRSKVLDSWQDLNKQGRKGIGFIKPPKPSRQPGRGGKTKKGVATSVKHIVKSLDKDEFIKYLSSIVKKNMANPPISANSKHVNFTQVLTRSIQECKMNPVYIYARGKGQLVECTPKRKGAKPKLRPQRGGFGCEVWCHDIYLATGYAGGGKALARDIAAELAVKLLQKPVVTVATVTRKCAQGYRDDQAAVSADTPMDDFPPAFDQEETVNDGPPKKVFKGAKDKCFRPLSDFKIIENSTDPVVILNTSAKLSNMAVDYRFDMMADQSFRCCVFVDDRYVAEGFGTQPSSKLVAATSAVKILKMLPFTAPAPIATRPPASGPKGDMRDFVIYENGANSVCTLNDTTQINKVNIEYVYEKAEGQYWRCKVFIEQQFIAEAVGVKKNVKHEAADATLAALKKTYPVMTNNVKKAPEELGALSRNRIRGVSDEEAYKQEIKEDNIGNRLLRKMGWTGGGLGKEGEGIAEPIQVKEQFSREGLGLMTTGKQITRREIDQVIRNYAHSHTKDDLTFSRELSNEERKLIHQIANKYGLKSKSHGKNAQRFLVVSRKMSRQALIDTLRQEGQVGSYSLHMPQN